MSEKDNNFLDQVGKTLDRGVQELDGEILNRLRQARLTATEPLGRHYPRSGWLLAGGVLAGVMVAVLLSLQIGSKSVPQPMLEDMALLSADTNMDLYRDLDFYEWLAQQEKHSGV